MTRPPAVAIAGRLLQPTEVFDTYWRFAAERLRVYEARLAGLPAPWTADPIVAQHRFTNAYRAADRVSQYLIREVAYTGSQLTDEVVFRVILFRMFNRISTWHLLQSHLGQLSWASFDEEHYDSVLSAASARGERLYSAAYVIPPPRLGAQRKHANHLRLLRRMMTDGLPGRLTAARSMEEAFQTLRAYPSMGDFLAYQMLIDVNYSSALNFDEMDFVVPGPGARDGIRKCFGAASAGMEAEVIAYMAARQQDHFGRLGLPFAGLRGRALQLVDCQNLFCEVDKYARVAHPHVAGISGRQRIKQKFTSMQEPVSAWFPPKWGLNGSIPPPVASDQRPDTPARTERQLVTAG